MNGLPLSQQLSEPPARPSESTEYFVKRHGVEHHVVQILSYRRELPFDHSIDPMTLTHIRSSAELQDGLRFLRLHRIKQD